MKIISIINQKGGVGKTTTAINLAFNIADQGKNVWLIDFDDSFNATKSLKIPIDSNKKTSFDLCKGDFTPNDLNSVNWEQSPTSFYFIPSNRYLASLKAYEIGCGSELRDGLDKLVKSWESIGNPPPDYIFIDSGPSLDVLNFNVMAASSDIYIIMQCQYLSLEGMASLLDTIKRMYKTTPYRPQVTGIIATMNDTRLNLARSVLEKIENTEFENILFNTTIRNNISLAEAPQYGLPINLYRPKSNGTIDYRNLAKEILMKEVKNDKNSI